MRRRPQKPRAVSHEPLKFEATAARCGIVASKIDQLARGVRIRAMRELESVCEHPGRPVSAVTGEGLDELWTLIDNRTNSRTPLRQSSLSRRNPNNPPGATAAPPPRFPKKTARRPKK